MKMAGGVAQERIQVRAQDDAGRGDIVHGERPGYTAHWNAVME
jgi:hypothetical protein